MIASNRDVIFSNRCDTAQSPHPDSLHFLYRSQHHGTLTTHRSMVGQSHWHPAIHRYQLSVQVTTHWQEPRAFKESHWRMYWTVSEHFLWSASFGYVCVCVCIDDLKSGRGGGRDAVIRSGPLTSLCADKAGHTLTHTHSPAMPRHQRLITHLCVITLWLLSPATTPYSFWDFFFLFYDSGGGFNRADLSQSVYRRSDACFILMKGFTPKQDFHQL